MKKLVLLSVISMLSILAGCDMSHNFMDVDNPNAKEDLKYFIGSWNIPRIDKDNIIPDNLSGTWNNAKWYAQKYYEDSLEEYVDVAKEGLSWTVQTLKWYYNDWVDQIHGTITNKVNWVISWEINKLKIQ